MKIIYSLNDNIDSRIQLSRFLKITNHEVKVFSHGICNLFDSDINLLFLDSLVNIEKNGDKINFLSDYIKKFKPDLIIYDDEYITPYIGYNLGIPCIEYSKNNLSCFPYSNFRELYEYAGNIATIRLAPIIGDVVSIYSNRKIEKCRPFTFKGSKTQEKNLHISCNNKKLLTSIDHYSYNNINSVEYFNSIASSDYCLIEFLYTFIVDAFYNNKYIYCYKTLTLENTKLFKILEDQGLAEFYNNNFRKKSIIDFEIQSKQLTDYIEEI
jgi:hypothetical protein